MSSLMEHAKHLDAEAGRTVSLSPDPTASGPGAEPEGYQTAHKMRELAGELAPEPLLVENKKRFVLFPLQYHKVRSPN